MEIQHPIECPRCGSSNIQLRELGRKAGGAIGTVAGGVSGVAGAMRGARIGSTVGSAAGPAGTLVGAVIGGLIGAATVGTAGAQIGHVIDLRVLGPSHFCLACKHTF